MLKDPNPFLRYRYLWLEIVKIINAVLITVPFALVWIKWYYNLISVTYSWRGMITVIAVFAVCYTMLGRTYQAFTIRSPRRSEIIYSQFLAYFVTDVLLYIILCLINDGILSVIPMLVVLAGQIALSIIWVFGAHNTYHRRVPPARTVVIWDTREKLDDLIKKKGMEKLFDVQRYVYVDDCINDMAGTLSGCDAAFMLGLHSHERNQIMKYCLANNIISFIIPRIGDVIMGGAVPNHIFSVPVFSVDKNNASFLYFFVKRAFDIIASFMGLVILSPLLAIIALLIKRDGGTAFYKQVRLTKDGKEFELIKFRSMRMDAEKDGVARLSSGENDDRITPIGRFIRKCRIDELPQLINILRGDMSVVGPRPERPEIAAEYEKVMPEFRLRLQAKAGLTGLAQVYGKYNTTPYDKLLMDLQYLAHPGIAQDVMIIFATIKILFMPESTEGVAAGQTTAMEQDIVVNHEEEYKM